MARSRDAVRVVLFDGQGSRSFEVDETAAGVLRSKVAPHYEFAADVCTIVAPGLYALAADDVTMRSEADFHRTRKRIATSALFENNSDMMDLARNIAVGVSVVVNVLVWFQVGHMAGLVDALMKHGVFK